MKAVLAPMAPPLSDPTRCRWCRGALRELLTPGVKDYCQNGCSVEPTTRAICAECEREFETGRPLMHATLCFTCETAERSPQEASYSDRRRYDYKRFGRGGYV